MNEATNPHDEEIIHVFIMESHSLLRQTLSSLIQKTPGLHLCGEAASAEETLEKLPDCQPGPDIILADVSITPKNRFSLIRLLSEQYPHVFCIALSLLDEIVFAPLALQAGARGYLMKSELIQLPEVIRSVYNGRIYLSATVKRSIDM